MEVSIYAVYGGEEAMHRDNLMVLLFKYSESEYLNKVLLLSLLPSRHHDYFDYFRLRA